MIKSAGNRISPTEVEEAAIASGLIHEAVALGVPDARLGEAIALVVRPDRRGEEEKLRAHLKSCLPNFMPAQCYHLARRAAAQPQRQARPGGAEERADGMSKPMGTIPAGFAADADGMLLIGGRRADELAGGPDDTPLFVYDLGLVDRQIARFRAAFPAFNCIMPSRQTLIFRCSRMSRSRSTASTSPRWASCARLALEAGGHAGEISFAGPGKRDAELDEAIGAGVTINLRVRGRGRARCRRRAVGRAARLAVRVNPDFEIKGSGMRMGGGAKPFGVDAARAAALVRRIVAAGAEWRGLHIFAGSQALDAGALIEAQRATLGAGGAARRGGRRGAAAGQSRRRLRPSLFPRRDGARRRGRGPGARRGASPARPPVLADTAFAIELGRWLVGEAGVYLTRIVDRKLSHGKTFLVTDGGMHHQLAASGNFGQVVRRNYPVAIASRFGAPPEEEGLDHWLPLHAARPARRRRHGAARRGRRPGRRLPRRRLRPVGQSAGVPGPARRARDAGRRLTVPGASRASPPERVLSLRGFLPLPDKAASTRCPRRGTGPARRGRRRGDM